MLNNDSIILKIDTLGCCRAATAFEFSLLTLAFRQFMFHGDCSPYQTRLVFSTYSQLKHFFFLCEKKPTVALKGINVAFFLRFFFILLLLGCTSLKSAKEKVLLPVIIWWFDHFMVLVWFFLIIKLAILDFTLIVWISIFNIIFWEPRSFKSHTMWFFTMKKKLPAFKY